MKIEVTASHEPPEVRQRVSGEEKLRIVAETVQVVAQSGPSELSDVLKHVTCAASRIADADEGTLFLFDFASDELHVAARDGDGEMVPERIKVGEGTPIDFAFQHSDETAISDDAIIASDGRTNALRSIPLESASNRLGLICLCARRDQLEVGSEERYLLRILASQAALAIEREQRRDEALRFSHALSQLYETSRTLSQPEDASRILEAIAQSALIISKADLIVLYEYFEEPGDVRIPPTVAGESRQKDVLSSRSIEVIHERSAVFRVLGREKPFYADDAPADWIEAGLIDSDAFAARENVKSSAGIPLRIDKERVGVLFINYRKPVHFSRDLKGYFERFANQAALAIGNARFFLRAERYSRNLTVLNEIGRELSSDITLDNEQIARLIDEQTQRVLETPNFFLCLHDEEEEQLQLVYIRDQHDVPENLSPDLQNGLAAYVWRTGESLLATREQQQKLFDDGKAKLVGTPSAIWLGAPMKINQKTLGAIVVQSYNEEAAYAEEHKELLTTVAAQAAIAITNSQLIRESNQRRVELTTLLTLWKTFRTQKLPLEKILSETLERILKLGTYDAGLLFLLSPGQDELKVFAASSKFDDYRGISLRLGEGLPGRVALSGEPMLVNDYDRWEGRPEVYDRFENGPPRAMVGVPLIWKESVVGVITLATRDEEFHFSQSDVHLLQRIADPVAIIIQSARDTAFRRALIDRGPNAIIAFDPRGHVTEFNAEAERILDYSREEALGKRAADLYWGGRNEATRLARLVETEERIDAEETFGRSRENKKIPIALSAARLHQEGDIPMGSVGGLEDLRLSALRGRTLRLVRAILDIERENDDDEMIDMIVLHAIDLLYADAGCLLNYDSGEDRYDMASCIDCDDACLEKLMSEPVQARIRELRKLDRDDIRIAAPGEEDWPRLLQRSKSSSLAFIQSPSRLLGALIVDSEEEDHFIADREMLTFLASQASIAINRVQLRSEKEQEQKQKKKAQHQLMVSANAIVIGQISTSFIHEAKNALNAMSLNVLSLGRAINREPELKSKTRYAEQLDVIESEIKRINDLALRLQRFTRQGLAPVKRANHLNQIITRTLDLLKSVLESKNLKCETKLDGSLDIPHRGVGNPIEVDDDQIQQVLMNLILNAAHASAQRGKIVVESSNHLDRVEIGVTDYGKGISGADRHGIFDPFFTTREGGTGLGLYISKLLVEDNHGGRIEIRSSLNKGSTFSVILPRG